MSVAAQAKVATAPAALVASYVWFAGAVIDGGVVSTTLTWNDAEHWFPEPSVALQRAVVVPNGNVLPEVMEYVIAGVLAISVAMQAKVATAPEGLVASYVRSAGAVIDGGVVSEISTMKVAWKEFPAASVAVQTTNVRARSKSVPLSWV